MPTKSDGFLESLLLGVRFADPISPNLIISGPVWAWDKRKYIQELFPSVLATIVNNTKQDSITAQEHGKPDMEPKKSY